MNPIGILMLVLATWMVVAAGTAVVGGHVSHRHFPSHTAHRHREVPAYSNRDLSRACLHAFANGFIFAALLASVVVSLFGGAL